MQKRIKLVKTRNGKQAIKFNGRIYTKYNRCFMSTTLPRTTLLRDIWIYHKGDIPKGMVISQFNKGNDYTIDNLRMWTEKVAYGQNIKLSEHNYYKRQSAMILQIEKERKNNMFYQMFAPEEKTKKRYYRGEIDKIIEGNEIPYNVRKAKYRNIKNIPLNAEKRLTKYKERSEYRKELARINALKEVESHKCL